MPSSALTATRGLWTAIDPRPLRVAIERDLYVRPAPFGEVMKQFRNERGL